MFLFLIVFFTFKNKKGLDKLKAFRNKIVRITQYHETNLLQKYVHPMHSGYTLRYHPFQE